MRHLYRLLLRIYPAGFREEYASALERQFADEYGETSSRRERIRFILRTLADLAVTAPAELARELWQDVRFAVRVYRRRSAATVLALVAMALAIGATTGIFSVLNAVMIRSLPFEEPERLVELRFPPEGVTSGREAAIAWRDNSQYLEDVAFYSPQPMNFSNGQESLRVTVSETTASSLRLLGIRCARGRGFAEDEDIPGQNRLAVIGYGFWQQAFGGDPQVIGTTIRLNGVPLSVIGVAPPAFNFPENTSIWVPTAFERELIPKGGAFVFQSVGRLKPGVSFDQAAAMYLADIDRANAGRSTREVQSGANVPRLVQLQERLAGPVRPAALVLMGMMVLVLLIACANLAHLLLSRATDRRHEIAIRAALGASRSRLTRQLITEATLLTASAAIVGLGVAYWTARLANAAQPAQLAARQYTVLDWRVLAFALGLASITGIIFGVLPASLIGRMQVRQNVIRSQSGLRGASAARLRGVLIALQVTLTVALTAASFSLGRGFLNLLGTDLGYETNRVVTMSVSFPDSQDRRTAFTRQALERLRAVHGVESAGAASYFPMVALRVYMAARLTLDSGEQAPLAMIVSVTPGYFRAMGTPVVEGRDFTDTDVEGAEPVVIVNEAFARELAVPALVGRRVDVAWGEEPLYATIVGIVRSHRFFGPDASTSAQIYRPLAQQDPGFATYVAKVRGDPMEYLAMCRDVVQGVDPYIPLYDVKTLDQRLADELARPRFYTSAIVFLACFALLVAAIGAYGAASRTVSQRSHEIGVRIAVGGPPGCVRGMIFRQAMAPVCAGVVAGLLAAAGLGRVLQHLMASAEPTGLWMSGSAAVTIAAATACAIWIATSRVVRTDPTAALRVE